jgi:transcriptional regulator with XRE-family HTH domain
MEKTKLIEVRESKKLLQKQIADQLNLDVSNYCKREKGLVYIKIEEWEKLAKILDVPLKEIYEPDENHTFICNDNDSCTFLGTNNGTNNYYTIQESLLNNQQKYITKLEEEIASLKRLLEKNNIVL